MGWPFEMSVFSTSYASTGSPVMKCQKTFERTGSTDLTDSELLILDNIAMLGGLCSMYLNDNFPYQFNYPEHGLDSKSLLATLARFESEGMIVSERTSNRHGKPDLVLRVTTLGGSIWESERKPDWTRYVEDSYGPSRRNTERFRVTILGHSREICNAFFDASIQSGFIDYRGGRVATAWGNRNLIYWRSVESVFMLSAWLESEDSETDWNHFEMKRCWWRFAHEIGKLWGWPPAELDA